MLELGLVVFNFDYFGFYFAIAVWVLMFSMMPRRAMIGLVLGALSCVWYMGLLHSNNPGAGEFFYVGSMFFMGFLFTCTMSPLMIIAFFLGYKTTR